jgi:hypothetical protein
MLKIQKGKKIRRMVLAFFFGPPQQQQIMDNGK